MPCEIEIKSFLNQEIYEKSMPALSMSFDNAKKLIAKVNKDYSYQVVDLVIADTMEIDINIPQTLVREYYANELLLEEKEARTAQIEDAERAGINYTDNYLFESEKTTEKLYNEFNFNYLEKLGVTFTNENNEKCS